MVSMPEYEVTFVAVVDEHSEEAAIEVAKDLIRQRRFEPVSVKEI